MDILKRLKDRIPQKSEFDRDRETMELAAAEINRLRAALKKVANCDSDGYEGYDQIAREALTAPIETTGGFHG